MQTANGKAILFGEHYVVYGAPAIAVAVKPGVDALAEPADEFDLRVPGWSFSAADAPSTDLARAFRALVDATKREHPSLAPVTVSIRCHLPTGVGLGSSGAIGVATARALLELAAPTSRPSLARLQALVIAWERVFHGNPSGFDHAVCMREGAVVGLPGSPMTFESLRPAVDRHFAVVVASEGASTARMVAQVATFRAQAPARFASMLAEARAIAGDAVDALTHGSIEAVGSLMTRNHALLAEVGVSTRTLDACIEQLLDAGALGAKLTGAGGGGAVIAAAKDRAAMASLIDGARAAGNRAFAAVVHATQTPAAIPPAEQ